MEKCRSKVLQFNVFLCGQVQRKNCNTLFIIYELTVHCSSVQPCRSGEIWKHDASLLQGGGGGVRGVRRDEGLHLWSGVQVEARPGQQGEAGQREPHPVGAAGQQVRPEEGELQQQSAYGQFLQGGRLPGLVRNLGQGEGLRGRRRSSFRPEFSGRDNSFDAIRCYRVPFLIGLFTKDVLREKALLMPVVTAVAHGLWKCMWWNLCPLWILPQRLKRLWTFVVPSEFCAQPKLEEAPRGDGWGQPRGGQGANFLYTWSHMYINL